MANGIELRKTARIAKVTVAQVVPSSIVMYKREQVVAVVVIIAYNKYNLYTTHNCVVIK